MNIQLDDKTIGRLAAVAALRNIPTEELVKEWFRDAINYHTEKAEEMKRLADVNENGSIAHDEMMDWLDDLNAGKNV